MNLQSRHDDSDVDPVYRMFLDNLREDVKSYTFETIDGPHCSPVCIKYEQCKSCHATKEANHFKNKVSHHRGPFCAYVAQDASFLDDQILEDESYNRFLGHVRVEDGFVLLDCEPNVYVKYEEVKTVLAISPNLQTGNTMFPGELKMTLHEGSPEHGFSPEKECASYNKAIVTSVCPDPLQYKQKLLKVLNQPFDIKEYTELLNEATERKPLIKHKHLRCMSKSYATNIPGMSYFDHHPDLARQFREADCYMGLALLRGFFFWLKNLCHEGSFMPWTLSNAEISATRGNELMLPFDESPIDEMSGLEEQGE